MAQGQMIEMKEKKIMFCKFLKWGRFICLENQYLKFFYECLNPFIKKNKK